MKITIKIAVAFFIMSVVSGCQQNLGPMNEMTDLNDKRLQNKTSLSLTGFDEIYQEYKNPDGRVLVAAHRADWRNHPENSLSAIQGAIDMGVDIVEIDVRKTQDGELVLMHDSTVSRTTNGLGSVSGMTLQQIKSLYLKSNQGGIGSTTTNERVPTLAEAMAVAEGQVMVNLDKSWEIREEVYAVLDSMDLVDHGIFKGSASNAEVESWLDSKNPRPNYMAIYSNDNTSDIDNMLSGASPGAYELIFDGENRGVISDTFLNKIKNNSKRIWINTLWSSLCAGHTDDISVSNPAGGWGWVLEKDASIIQTDRPAQLIDYLNPPQPSELPDGWLSSDIGAVGAAGSASYADEIFTLTGSGWDVWDTYDEFQYVYKNISGDATITARITSMDNTHPWAKAGVMIRQTLDPGSKFADVCVTPSYGISFQQREYDGQDCGGDQHTESPGNVPEFVKLVKHGSSFTAYHSETGDTWTQIGSPETIDISGDYCIGMFVTSHNDGTRCTANFENLQMITDSTGVTEMLQQGVDGYYGTEDAHILEYYKYPDRNTGGNNLIETATYKGSDSDEKNILLRFDLSGIPSNASVTSASLELFLASTRNGTPVKEINLHEILSSWDEGTGVGIDGQDVPGVDWHSAPIIDETALSSIPVGSQPEWYRFSLTSLVQDWIDDSAANYGIMLKEDTVVPVSGTKQFASSEYSAIDKRPRLIITYTE